MNWLLGQVESIGSHRGREDSCPTAPTRFGNGGGAGDCSADRDCWLL